MIHLNFIQLKTSHGFMKREVKNGLIQSIVRGVV